MTNRLKDLTPAQLDKFQGFLNTKEECGRTPLFLAADADRVRCAIVLLQYGASTEEVDMHKMTPLCAAVRKGHVNMIKTLLSYGANPNVLIDGRTMVEVARSSIESFSDCCEIIRLLLVRGCVVPDEVIDQMIADCSGDDRLIMQQTIDLARTERARKYTSLISSFAPLPASADPTKKSPMNIISEFTSFENPFE